MNKKVKVLYGLVATLSTVSIVFVSLFIWKTVISNNCTVSFNGIKCSAKQKDKELSSTFQFIAKKGDSLTFSVVPNTGYALSTTSASLFVDGNKYDNYQFVASEEQQIYNLSFTVEGSTNINVEADLPQDLMKITFDAGKNESNHIEGLSEHQKIVLAKKGSKWSDFYRVENYIGAVQENYNFVYWTFDSNIKIDDDFVIDSNITIYPKFIEKDDQYLLLSIRSKGLLDLNMNLSLKYSMNNSSSFVEYDGMPIEVNTGDIVYLKRELHVSVNAKLFNKNKKMAAFAVSGHLNSLINNREDCPAYCYDSLFSGCTTLISAINLILPTNLTDSTYCLNSFFDGCTSLICGPNELPALTLSNCCYEKMFKDCSSLTIAPTLLATTLADSCYALLFENCSKLTKAPVLPVTELANSCYLGMFKGCTSLEKAPVLAATTLKTMCYSSMFDGCSSLKEAPVLNSTTLANDCYSAMFKGCTSITKVPALPAEVLKDYCYSSMFRNCKGITTAPILPVKTLVRGCYADMLAGTSITAPPDLPATTLADSCYANMFQDCSNLKYAPKLDVKQLRPYCYEWMFANCTSLLEAPDLPATTLPIFCYNVMFLNCTSLKKAPKINANTISEHCCNSMFGKCTSLESGPTILPATKLAPYCYYSMFRECPLLKNAPELPATTLEENCYESMFEGCSKINYIKVGFVGDETTPWPTAVDATKNWLKNVASDGTFVWGTTYNPNRGPSTIPTNWSIK